MRNQLATIYEEQCANEERQLLSLQIHLNIYSSAHAVSRRITVSTKFNSCEKGRSFIQSGSKWYETRLIFHSSCRSSESNHCLHNEAPFAIRPRRNDDLFLRIVSIDRFSQLRLNIWNFKMSINPRVKLDTLRKFNAPLERDTSPDPLSSSAIGATF